MDRRKRLSYAVSMNPYAKFLGGDDPLAVIAATGQRLSALLPSMDADRAPTPGKWSASEILCHLADCEVVFAFRLRQAAAQPHHTIQPFDQDEWAKVYSGYSAPDALNVFSTLRNWNLAFLKAVPPETFAKTLNHPERGDMTFQTVVETMAGHDLNHLQQMDALAAKAQ
jgi:hypothetical protein